MAEKLVPLIDNNHHVSFHLLGKPLVGLDWDFDQSWMELHLVLFSISWVMPLPKEVMDKIKAVEAGLIKQQEEYKEFKAWQRSKTPYITTTTTATPKKDNDAVH